jgi:hypothetical protein
MTFLKKTTENYKKRMNVTFKLTFIPALLWATILFNLENYESLVSRVLAGVLTPLMIALTPVTLVLGIAATVLQAIAFPFECLVSKIRDMIRSKRSPAGSDKDGWSPERPLERPLEQWTSHNRRVPPPPPPPAAGLFDRQASTSEEDHDAGSPIFDRKGYSK